MLLYLALCHRSWSYWFEFCALLTLYRDGLICSTGCFLLCCVNHRPCANVVRPLLQDTLDDQTVNSAAAENSIGAAEGDLPHPAEKGQWVQRLHTQLSLSLRVTLDHQRHPLQQRLCQSHLRPPASSLYMKKLIRKKWLHLCF